MSDRYPIAALAVFALLVACRATTPTADTTPRPQPNVLYIITDQQSASLLSCAGDRYVSTPALDRLASEGARFERAYCTNPVCIPSRVSMMTGFYPSRFGMRWNSTKGITVPDEVLRRSLGHGFRAAGYETAYGGKTHWPRDMTPDSIGFDYLTEDEREGLAETCAEFIRRSHDRPFLLVASFINPHDICYMAIDDFTKSQGKPVMYARSVEERKQLAAALELPAGVSQAEFFEKHCPPLPPNYEPQVDEPEAVRALIEQRAFRANARW